MKNPIVTIVFAGLLACGAPGARAAQGSDEKAAQPAKPEHKQRAVAFHGKVKAVDKVAKTVTVEGKEKDRTVQVTSETKITRDGKPAVFDALAVGESVGGRAKENAGGKLEALSLSVGAKPEKPKPHGKKPDAK